MLLLGSRKMLLFGTGEKKILLERGKRTDNGVYEDWTKLVPRVMSRRIEVLVKKRCDSNHKCAIPVIDVMTWLHQLKKKAVFLATGEEDMSQRTYFDTENASRGLGKFIVVVLGGGLWYIGKFLVGEGFEFLKMRECEVKITDKIEEFENEIDIYTIGKITETVKV
ncbi:unnamed protein product [Microthlaspi erraticum]|uniref:Uncharacterized protein n=1 Tax=Microthlaspi erraticum TaxID=1685480 RepID=A0A6D2ITM8_9BRAS|nr:unnamed protein product [Microthlaspi erraticum]